MREDEEEGAGSTAPEEHMKLPVTPLPMRTLLPLVIVLMNECICASMLLPFVGLLVAHLERESENEAGYLSGFLVSAFQLGQVISGWFWGRLSDVYGRRVALMLGLLCSGVVMVLFGFSGDVRLCIALRFLHGLFNGNVLVAKTVIADITDKTNEARGFSMISLSWGVGSLIGPAVGGLLYDSGSLFDSFGLYAVGGLMRRYPQLLPSLMVACYSFVALAVAWKYVVETNRHARPISELFRRSTKGQQQHEDKEDATVDQAPPSPSASAHFGYVDAFSNPVTRVCISLYVLICASDIMYWETMPLWAIATRDSGGLAMPSSVLGMIIVLNGIPCILANLLFSRADAFFLEKMNLWRTSMLIWGSCVLVLPFAAALDHPFGAIMLNCCIRQFGSSWSFSLVFLVIARTAPAGHVGSMNGIAQSCGCAIRTLVPLLAAPLFAWSISARHIYPFNYHLVFFSSVCVLAAAAALSKFLSNKDLHSASYTAVPAEATCVEDTCSGLDEIHVGAEEEAGGDGEDEIYEMEDLCRH